MTAVISLEELLDWNCEAANSWKSHLNTNPALLQLPCDIGGNADVVGLVRHIWGAELIWSQRIAGLAQRDKATWPIGPLEALFDLHLEAERNFRALLKSPDTEWDGLLIFRHPALPIAAHDPSRRKVMAHALVHSQRHWAQLTTLVRVAGFPSEFKGDLLFSSALA